MMWVSLFWTSKVQEGIKMPVRVYGKKIRYRLRGHPGFLLKNRGDGKELGSKYNYVLFQMIHRNCGGKGQQGKKRKDIAGYWTGEVAHSA